MLKFGFIGLGQAGGKITDAFQSLNGNYVSLVINTAKSDMASLQHVEESHRYGLFGSEYGAGRSPEVAYNAIFEEKNAQEIFERINRLFKDCDYVWLVAGLGGGTGTGLMQAFVDHALDSFPFPVGAIITIPTDKDGAIQKYNTLETLTKIQNALDQKKLASVIVVDNERFLSQFAEQNKDGDWKEIANITVAELIHSINLLTEEAGSDNFDRADFLKLLNAYGCISIGKAKLRKFDKESLLGTIKNTIDLGFLSRGYRKEESTYYALLYTLNEEGQQIKSAAYEKYIAENLGANFTNALDHFIGYYTTQEESSIMTILAGLGLPERVFELQKQIEGLDFRQVRKNLSVNTQKPSFLQNINNPLLNNKRPISGPNPFLKKDPVQNFSNAANPFLKRS